MVHGQSCQWNICNIEDETPRVRNLYLASEGDRPSFVAGQYLTIRLPERSPAEGKAYSISSAPHEPFVRISIKQIGAFSEALRALRIGDTLLTSLPYGFFYPEPEETMPLVFVAGGIGIAPCLSIIKDLLYRKSARPLVLHYSNQTKEDVAFLEELNMLAAKYPSLTVHQYLTRETPIGERFIAGRMTPEHILPALQQNKDVECFICGGMDFTKSLWKSLHHAGVPQHQLYTEGFF